MKQFFSMTILIVMFMVLGFQGCGDQQNQVTAPISEPTISNPSTPQSILCPKTAVLVCGQHTVLGTVSIWPKNGGIYITLDTDDTTVSYPAKIYVGMDSTSLPLNGGGNPQMNKFYQFQLKSAGTTILWSDLRAKGMNLPNSYVSVCNLLYGWIHADTDCGTAWWGERSVAPGGHRWWRSGTFKSLGGCCTR